MQIMNFDELKTEISRIAYGIHFQYISRPNEKPPKFMIFNKIYNQVYGHFEYLKTEEYEKTIVFLLETVKKM